VDGCEFLHQLIDGNHPIIYRVEKPSELGGAGFRNHPQYHGNCHVAMHHLQMENVGPWLVASLDAPKKTW
jgi:hypothetical protein